MQITKGLIIDEPWISKILNGEKVWEMRSNQATHRGSFALIRKGSGQVIGVANLSGVSGPYNVSSLVDTLGKHCVEPFIFNQPDYKWWYAWELSEVVRLSTPVRYIHKNGAVTWVQLDAAAIHGVNARLDKCPVNPDILQHSVVAAEVPIKLEASNQSPTREAVTSGMDKGADASLCGNGTELRITLTQGNINNSHFYIPRQTALFPKSVWGGKNKSAPGREVEFNFQGLDYTVLSDIDSSKRILRKRGATKEFYRLHQVEAGNEIRIRGESDGTFAITLGR